MRKILHKNIFKFVNIANKLVNKNNISWGVTKRANKLYTSAKYPKFSQSPAETLE